MTHDELLAIVDVNALVNPKPLLAVIKLHKPFIVKNELLCEMCCADVYLTNYPCPTIQAIEKELINA